MKCLYLGALGVLSCVFMTYEILWPRVDQAGLEQLDNLVRDDWTAHMADCGVAWYDGYLQFTRLIAPPLLTAVLDSPKSTMMVHWITGPLRQHRFCWEHFEFQILSFKFYFKFLSSFCQVFACIEGIISIQKEYYGVLK